MLPDACNDRCVSMSPTSAGHPDGWFQHIREHAEVSHRDLRLIRAYAPSATTVLDVGAGRGAFIQEALRAGLSGLALDCNADAAAIWKRNGVPGVLADAIAAPFRDHIFDVVRAKEIIEHVPDALGFVSRLRQLIRPGGLFLVHVPSPYSQAYPVGNFWDDYTHVRPFSRLGLRRLLEDAGMTMEYLTGYTVGRSGLERLLALALTFVLPHTYLAVARVPRTGLT
jgi:SAM-dependent methyltransferase